MNINQIKDSIRNISNFPKEGIQFKDITPLLMDSNIYNQVIEILKNRYQSMNIDVIIGIESRGFIFAGPLSLSLNCSFALARKKGKLPYKTVNADYELEYGKDFLELHKDSINPGDNVLIVDDLLATGGTTKAVIEMVEQLSGNILEVAYLIELTELKGSQKFSDKNIFSIVKYWKNQFYKN